MFDLLAVAYQADLTRVFTFMMAREASQRTYPALGIAETHHDVSHHGNRAEKMELHAKINTHFTALFAKFVEKLRATPEGDGSVLDHSLIIFGAGMSDGQAHTAYPLPLARSAARAAGSRATASSWPTSGRRSPTSGSASPDMFGSPLEKFGESTGAWSSDARSPTRGSRICTPSRLFRGWTWWRAWPPRRARPSDAAAHRRGQAGRRGAVRTRVLQQKADVNRRGRRHDGAALGGPGRQQELMRLLLRAGADARRPTAMA